MGSYGPQEYVQVMSRSISVTASISAAGTPMTIKSNVTGKNTTIYEQNYTKCYHQQKSKKQTGSLTYVVIKVEHLRFHVTYLKNLKFQLFLFDHYNLH